MRLLQINNLGKIKKIMQGIGVDPYGIDIMLPKAAGFLVKIDSISNISANILKQEMLSLGAEAAVSRGALTGKTKKTDCLLMGNLSQYSNLGKKLLRQPFGLNRLGQELSRAIENYQKDNFNLDFGRYKLHLSRRCHIMGILNMTPDSFSNDGFYGRNSIEEALKQAERLAEDGADIIDVGGESSRPGARPISVKEEIARTTPIIKKIAKKIKVPVSIDSCKPEVLRSALDSGASMINDITGLRDKKIAKIAARNKAALVIMHMRGTPRTMQRAPKYTNVVEEVMTFLASAADFAQSAGVKKEKIFIDPGLGFGKAVNHNLEILRRLSEFKVMGFPILVGPSRKSFIGAILGSGLNQRVLGTAASCLLAAKNGANMVRVHDVREIKQALRVFEAINN